MLNTLLRLPPSRSSCRCISCLSPATNATLRRPKPFQLQFNQLTTLFYATIISAAAAADVRSKRRRRTELDTAIAVAQRSLHTDSVREDSQEVARTRNKYLDEDTEVGLLGRDEDYQEELEEDHEETNSFPPEQHDDPALQRNLRNSIIKSFNPDPDQMQRRHPQIAESYRVSRTSIYAGIIRRSIIERKAWTPKKLATVELSVAKMTVRFALETYKDTPESSPFWDIAGHLDASFRRNYVKSLQDLEEKQVRLKACDAFDLSNFEHVEYPRYDEESMLDTTATYRLHSALLSVFRRLRQGQLPIQEALSRISYNLMSAPCAPSVQTYNILLSRFSRLEETALADIVVDSFRESHIRPNELIIPTIIAHYSRSGNKHGFETFLRVLQGERGGLMLANPRTPTNGVAARARRIIQRGEKIIQRMTLDPGIFYSIINTHLRFDNGPAALSWLSIMRRQKIEPDLPLMVSFLRFELRQVKQNMNRVSATWHEIRRTWLSPEKLLELDHVEYKFASNAYFNMLHFYRERALSLAWHNTYAEALSRGFTMKEVLIDKPDHRIPAREKEAVNRIRLLRKILERRYELLKQDFKNFEVHAMAAKIILSRLPMRAVFALFERHDEANREIYKSWKIARPWLDTTRYYAMSDEEGVYSDNVQAVSADDTTEHNTVSNEESMSSDKVQAQAVSTVPTRLEAIKQLARKKSGRAGFVYAARPEGADNNTTDKLKIKLTYEKWKYDPDTYDQEKEEAKAEKQQRMSRPRVLPNGRFGTSIA